MHTKGLLSLVFLNLCYHCLLSTFVKVTASTVEILCITCASMAVDQPTDRFMSPLLVVFLACRYMLAARDDDEFPKRYDDATEDVVGGDFDASFVGRWA